MSPGVIQVRADICGDCATPCELRACADAHADPCAACPLRHWGQWGDCTGEAKSEEPKRLRGLGDAVAVVAEPIARALGIDKAKCGCAKRQDWLNAKVPFRRT